MFVETISGRKATTDEIFRAAVRRVDLAGTAAVCGLVGAIAAATMHPSPLPFRAVFGIMVALFAGVWYYVRRSPPRAWMNLFEKQARRGPVTVPSFAMFGLCVPLCAAMGYLAVVVFT
jgi:hypothetical protein